MITAIEEGMAHVLENLNNVEIKIAPSHLSQRGRYKSALLKKRFQQWLYTATLFLYHPITGRPTITTGQRALLVTLFIVHPV